MENKCDGIVLIDGIRIFWATWRAECLRYSALLFDCSKNIVYGQYVVGRHCQRLIVSTPAKCKFRSYHLEIFCDSGHDYVNWNLSDNKCSKKNYCCSALQCFQYISICRSCPVSVFLFRIKKKKWRIGANNIHVGKHEVWGPSDEGGFVRGWLYLGMLTYMSQLVQGFWAALDLYSWTCVEN